jgi:hypothetical protein
MEPSALATNKQNRRPRCLSETGANGVQLVKSYHTSAPDGTTDFKTASNANVYQELVHVAIFPHTEGTTHG